jgi:polysaccharide biosynthesis protein PslH
MRILIVSPKVPYPATDGGRIAIFEPIRQLAERGHSVTLLALCPPQADEGDFAPLASRCQLELIRHDTRSHAAGAAANLLSPLPYTIAKYHSQALGRQLEWLVNAGRYDVLQLENLHSGVNCPFLAARHPLPVLLRAHNVESLLAHRYAESQHGLRRLYARLHAAKLQRYEATISAQADACLAITHTDAALLKQLNPHIKTYVVPAGVDLAHFEPQPGCEEPATVVSVAAMDWRPNVDAALWFCREVWPIVRQQWPLAQFYIVGKNPPPSIRTLDGQAGVHVTGFVADVRDYFARGSLFIVPLRSGSGMRLKILEAMAMGRAVISTTIGAEGIAVTPGRDILLADDAASFADAVCRGLADERLRATLGTNARQLVIAQYSWAHAADLLESAYRSVSQTQRTNA